MKTLLVTTPRAKIEAEAVRDLIPEPLAGWHIEALPSGSLNQTVACPDVTLVQIDDDTKPADLKAIMPRLVQIQARGYKPSYVLFSIKKPKPTTRARQSQQRISSALNQITLQLPTFPNPQLVDVTFAQTPVDIAAQLTHIGSKLDLSLQILDLQLPKAVPRPSPLDRVKEVLRATEDLRVSNGNLSAAAVATAFGVSVNQLAAWLGRSRQALSKTPDADTLQDPLSFFERVARLRAVLAKGQFLKWLRMPNPELDGQTPLALLASGERQVVADLVDDMLTGAPA